MRAGIWPYKDADGNRTIFDAAGAPEPRLNAYFSGTTQRFLFNGGQIYLDSASLLGQDASRASYRIENIRWTQYFTNDGQAIHENFWRDPKLFGIPSSHGCLGLGADDARWFWEWAARGTPLSAHS